MGLYQWKGLVMGFVMFSLITQGRSLHLRLANGGSNHEGRLEVFYDGDWGTVCDDGWDINDAQVACRMLGYPGADYATSGAAYGEGRGPIVLDDVRCNGTERSLEECQHSGFPRHDCQHENDAGVVCSLPVRLAGGRDEREGRLEHYRNGTWTAANICDGGFTPREAHLACRVLGFLGVETITVRASISEKEEGVGLGNFQCYLICSVQVHECERQGADYPCDPEVGNCYNRGETHYCTCDTGYELDSDGWNCNDIDECERHPCDVTNGACLNTDGSYECRCNAGYELDTDGRTCSDINECQMQGVDFPCDAQSGVCFNTEGSYECFCHPGYGLDADGRTCNVMPLKLRLVDGAHVYEGRVEVYLDDDWGTICDDAWDILDATVVCQSVGWARAENATATAYFGEGKGPIALADVECLGIEENLAYCQHGGFFNHSCEHSEDAGVVCSSEDIDECSAKGDHYPCDADHGDCVNYYGSYECVCDGGYELDFDRSTCIDIDECASSDAGYPCDLVNGQCFNTDGSYECTCNAGFSFGSDPRTCIALPLQVRLVGGRSEREGRVEIYYNATWGTVCDDGWDITDANVICRMLNFHGAEIAEGSAAFGQGEGHIILDDVRCHGNEESISSCPHSGYFQHDCGHSEDAGVICQPRESQIEVRLADGASEREGRVEIYYDGVWSTVCDDLWDINDADVICRMLDLPGAENAEGSAYFGQGHGEIILDDVRCHGDESNIQLCPHNGYFQHNCGHGEDAGVTCQQYVRLADGESEEEGRVEVYHDGAWGTICDDDWDIHDADVVCRMLGFSGAESAPGSATFGQGQGDILLDDVRCHGNEESIKSCPHGGFFQHDCGHAQDAGVICQSIEVRLADGPSDREGRVEIYYNGTWGTVCDDDWDFYDADVICRMLGFRGAESAPGSAYFGQGRGEIVLDNVACYGNEDNIRKCRHNGYLKHNCEHREDAGVICQR